MRLLAEDIRNFVETNMDDQEFTEVKTKVMEWAIKKRLAGRKKGLNRVGKVGKYRRLGQRLRGSWER